MYVDVILPRMIGPTLFGLACRTESTLEIRQRRRDNGEDIKTYL